MRSYVVAKLNSFRRKKHSRALIPPRCLTVTNRFVSWSHYFIFHDNNSLMPDRQARRRLRCLVRDDRVRRFQIAERETSAAIIANTFLCLSVQKKIKGKRKNVEAKKRKSRNTGQKKNEKNQLKFFNDTSNKIIIVTGDAHLCQ